MQPETPSRLEPLRTWLHRRRWWIRLAIAIILAPVLGHFVYTRLTTMPPRPPGDWDQDLGLVHPPPEIDRTKDLAAAIDLLPPLVSFFAPTTAPSGKQWVRLEAAPSAGRRNRRGARRRAMRTAPASIRLDPSEALYGVWAPSKRFHLRQIIAYLRRPDVNRALDAIAALSDQPFCLTSSHGRYPWGTNIRRVAKLLAARARYMMEEKQDVARAVADVQALLQLTAGVEDDQTVIRLLVAAACRNIALREVICWSREGRLGPGPARDLLRWLTAHPYDHRRACKWALAGEGIQVQQVLDQGFTKDGRGNGWYVVYRRKVNPQIDAVMSALNVLSPFFNDRRTARHRLHLQMKTLTELGDMRYGEARSIFKAARAAWKARRNPADGMLPFPAVPVASYSRAYDQCAGTEAKHAATIVVLALSTYHSEHGRYPANLSMLVPEHLEAIPIDPFCDEPLRYRLDEKDGFVVYSVGGNGSDDGGIYRDKDGNALDSSERKDVILTEPRSSPYEEWVLVPQQDTAPSRDDDQPK